MRYPFFFRQGLLPVLVLVLLASFLHTARADITVTGDYDPTNEAFWTGGGSGTTDGYIGESGTGTLALTGSSTLQLRSAYVGSTAGSNGTVTLNGGTLAVANNLYVGNTGTGSLTINGGAVTVGLSVGLGTTASGQGSLILTAGSLVITGGGLTVGSRGQGSLLVTGGTVSSGGGIVGGVTHAINNATITGRGTLWTIADNLTVGYSSTNNSLTLSDGGLVKVGDTNGDTIQFNIGGTGNVLQLGDGYLALYGDQTAYIGTLIAAGDIQLWDGSAWVTNTDTVNYTYTYFATNEAAQALTGYDDLGGYTVLTPVPEPDAWRLIGLGCLAILFFRQRKKTARTA